MKIEVFGEVKKYDNPIRVVELLKKNEYKYFAAKVNNRLRELDYIIDTDAKVEFLDLTSSEAVVIYQSTLRYLIVMAIKRVYPNVNTVFNYSISRSIFAKLNGFDVPFDINVLSNIQTALKSIIDADLPIKRTTLSINEAYEYYRSNGYNDKAEILKYRPEETVHTYTCDEYSNYMFGYMLPSTKYIKDYKFKLYAPGFIIQYPRAEFNGEIPPFEDAPAFGKALKEANEWGSVIDGSYIAKMNKIIEDNRAVEFINLCETKHNNSLAELGMLIKNDINNIRLIAIAGPSSSGKTTFTNRLKVQLMSRGINPLMISIDDFYLGKAQAPKDEFGQPDLEHINALDTELFNNNIYELIKGNEVTLPHFNFETGKREIGKTVKLLPNQPIMIEGIHALNDDLTPSIPLHQKYKIYIDHQAKYNIDDHNPISLTDIRLIRRIVRDSKFRNYPAENTLDMWGSVRRGEFRWIYPNQEKANYVFNSELTYELCVMKKHALKMLQEISNDSEHYIVANRLIKFLKYFKDIDDTWIPCNSILREFIGGSMFYID